MASKDLKQRFDTLVACDESTDTYYNAIFHECLDTVTSEMANCDEQFRTLYQRTHYGGSFWDKLRVGNTRHEFDLNLLFRVPSSSVAIGKEDATNQNFMKLDVLETAKDVPAYICDVDDKEGKSFVSPKKMFDIIERAGDRAVTKLGSKICLKDGRQVAVTRSVGAPYTLHFQTQNGSDDRIDVDLVPAVELPLEGLPGKLRERVRKIQSTVTSGESKANTYLTIALPKVDKEKFEIDFPLVAREVLKGRPSARMAVRLLKQERDAKGGPMAKLWSHSIKTAVMHEVTKNPDPLYWHEALLPDRLNDVRTALQNHLSSNKMNDLFFPGVNMMARIKKQEVRTGVSNYLGKDRHRTGPAERNTPCPVSGCNRMMKGEEAARQHAEARHGYRGKDEGTARVVEDKNGFSGKNGPRYAAKDTPCSLQRAAKDTPCLLGICDKKLRGAYGSVCHSVDKHREEADKAQIWKSFLESIGKIPCGFCNCSGGKVRGFSSMQGYNAHIASRNH